MFLAGIIIITTLWLCKKLTLANWTENSLNQSGTFQDTTITTFMFTNQISLMANGWYWNCRLSVLNPHWWNYAALILVYNHKPTRIRSSLNTDYYFCFILLLNEMSCTCVHTYLFWAVYILAMLYVHNILIGLVYLIWCKWSILYDIWCNKYYVIFIFKKMFYLLMYRMIVWHFDWLS